MGYKETKLKRKSLYRLETDRNYTYLEKEKQKINPIFLERPHYGIPEKGREKSNEANIIQHGNGQSDN